MREFNSKEHIKNLSKERDELLYLSLERGNIVQVKGVCFLFHEYEPLNFTVNNYFQKLGKRRANSTTGEKTQGREGGKNEG